MGEKRTEERERRNISMVERKSEEEEDVWAHLWSWVSDRGSHIHQILQKYLISQFSTFENTKILFSFFIIHVQNFEFLSHGNSHPKSSQTVCHPWDSLGLDDESWKLSDITKFLWYPNKLLLTIIPSILEFKMKFEMLRMRAFNL